MSIEDGKQYIHQYPPPPKIANPGPLGLCGFALTTFVLSIHNAGSSDVAVPHITIGLALFYGGLAQLLAGMWEFKTGNTFGATAFSSYGAFWLSFATILIPSFGVHDSFGFVTSASSGINDTTALAVANAVPTANFEHAIGIYLLGWTIFTFLLFLATFRATGGIMSPVNIATKVGGILGIITALIAWYNALAGLLTTETSYFTIPTFDLSRKHD
ncbi:1109_t:CDS:2 [Scutellospora calospora]|uniref:1109_t:CDS:1 n=1 Tax=Scutellospora calospora TaxID=85575 RepID=A0ACA9MW28_9GLOM|nr:1109_t:CDS:2 [Scutellospora calospora]